MIHLDDSVRSTSINPDKILWGSVLLDAIYTACRPATVSRHRKTRERERSNWQGIKAKESALEWFASGAYYIGSFIYICEILGYVPSVIRDRVNLLSGRHLHRVNEKRFRDGRKVRRGRLPDAGLSHRETKTDMTMINKGDQTK